MSQPATIDKPKSTPGLTPADTFRQTWLYRFILLPLGQILFFIVGAAVLMTLLVFLFAYLLPSPNQNIFLPDQIARQLPSWIINGVSLGFLYAMIALGYTMVYGVLKFINFAHSEIFMVGGIVGFEVTARIHAGGHLADWHPVAVIGLMVLCAMIVSGLLAVFIERVAYRPLRSAPKLVPLITAIGISFILQDVVRAVMQITRGQFDMVYPTKNIPLYSTAIRAEIMGTNVSIRPTFIVIILSAIVMLLALNYFVNGTKWGRGIRAVSQDPTMAGLLGINVNMLISLTFLIGGALGGAAGALYGMNTGTVNAYIGTAPGLKAFIAAVLGGIGNLTGALLGGMLIGMMESYLNGFLFFYDSVGLGFRWTDVFVFTVLILMLLFRPSGILGEKVDEKV
jgi:branched-chain amino acid transport system permease protein